VYVCVRERGVCLEVALRKGVGVHVLGLSTMATFACQFPPPIYSNSDAVQAYRCNVEVIFNYDDAVVVKHVEHVCEGKPEMPCDLVISDKIAVLGRMRWNGQIWLLFRTK